MMFRRCGHCERARHTWGWLREGPQDDLVAVCEDGWDSALTVVFFAGTFTEYLCPYHFELSLSNL